MNAFRAVGKPVRAGVRPTSTVVGADHSDGVSVVTRDVQRVVLTRLRAQRCNEMK